MLVAYRLLYTFLYNMLIIRPYKIYIQNRDKKWLYIILLALKKD